MKDIKERQDQNSIAFFDADKTLWKVISTNPGDDYASKGAFDHIPRTFVLTQKNEVTRLEDKTKFILKDGVIETLEKLSKEGIITGIISDNENVDVEKIATFLGIWKYFDSAFINIRLWKGPANKSLMISETLRTQKNQLYTNITLVDDSERYSEQMIDRGYNFILSPKDTFPKDEIFSYFGIK